MLLAAYTFMQEGARERHGYLHTAQLLHRIVVTQDLSSCRLPSLLVIKACLYPPQYYHSYTIIETGFARLACHVTGRRV